ncbi:MAG: sulfatase-like hydrolase/transferase [Phycisphaerae bacterium]|nr:sulfatase-like hydrolase/transferase [Phycisphaerae bacterium]
MKLSEQISKWVTRRRNTTLGLLAGSAAAGTLPATAEAEAQTQAKPRNVILILADDLGWTGINCEDGYDASGNVVRGKYSAPTSLPEATPEQGNFHTNYFTPHLAELRQESMRFTNAYAYPWCKATRMSLLTGKNLERTIAMRDVLEHDTPLLSLAETTIAEALDAGGTDYHCGWFGKNHTMDIPGATSTGHNPTAQGFDRFVDYQTLGFPLGGTSPASYIKNGNYLTDELTRAACIFMEEAKGLGKPFFLYLPYYAPHAPTPNLNAEFASAPGVNSYKDVKDYYQLKAYFRFEDSIRDSLGHSVTSEGTMAWVPGVVKHWGASNEEALGAKGRALYLDGRSSLQMADYAGVLSDTPRTVAAWVKCGTGQLQTIVSWGSKLTDGQSWNMYISASGCLGVHVGSSGITDDVLVGDGSWRHVAVVHDAGAGDNIRLYVDGIERRCGSLPIDTVSGLNVQIGRDTNCMNYFNGSIDDLRIYSRVLDADEISYLKEQKLHENLWYAALVHRLDYNIGKVMEKVNELGIADNTAIIFLSDNGGRCGIQTADYNGDDSLIGDFGYSTKNYPLREYKQSTYEGGIRVPMLIKAPGETQLPSLCERPVTVSDILPTVYELAYGKGTFDYGKHFVDGRSLRPLIDNPRPGKTTFSRTYDAVYRGAYDDLTLHFGGRAADRKVAIDAHSNKFIKFHSLIHWPLDEIIGGQTPDAEKVHAAKVNGAVSTDADRARLGRSFRFKGGYVTSRTIHEWVRSFSMWVWVDNLDCYPLYIHHGDKDLCSRVRVTSSGTVIVQGYDSTATIYVDGVPGGMVKPGTWHHIAIAGTKSRKDVEICMGEQASGYPFRGNIDDVRIMGHLSPTVVEALAGGFQFESYHLAGDIAETRNTLNYSLALKLENWLDGFKVARYPSGQKQPIYHHTLFDAIEQSEPNSTIVVPPATFYENITINKNLTLRSWDPYDPHIVAATIIDGQSGVGATISIASGVTCTIEGITITREKAGGVDGGGSNNVIMKNCRVLNKTAL